LQLKHFFQNLAGAVSRAVIDEDNFLAELGVDDAAKDLVNRGFFIVNGNDDGEFGIHQSSRVAAVRGHKLRGKFSGGAEGE